MRTELIRAAFWGMIAWQAYAILEYAGVTLIPLARYHMVIADWHWKLSLELFGLYSAAGLLAGGLAGLVFRRNFPACAGLTLTLALLAHRSRHMRRRY